jgi:hypothetical protein
LLVKEKNAKNENFVKIFGADAIIPSSSSDATATYRTTCFHHFNEILIRQKADKL